MFVWNIHQQNRREFPAGILKYAMSRISFLSISWHSNDKQQNENDIKIEKGIRRDKAKHASFIVALDCELDCKEVAKKLRHLQ